MSAESHRVRRTFRPALRTLSCGLMLLGAGFGGLAGAAETGIPDWLENPLDVPQIGAPTGTAGVACRDVAGAAPLSLSDALEIAACRHPQMAAAQAAIRAQAASLGEAEAASLPKLNASFGRLRTTTRYTDTDAPADTVWGSTRSLSLSWRVFDFGTREAGRDAAGRLLTAAVAARDAALQRLMAELVAAYFDAITARAVSALREHAVTQAEATLATAQRREQRGLAAGSDVLQARAQLAKAQLTLARAHGDERKTVAVLAHAMGLAGGTTLTLPDQLDDPDPQDADDLQRWLDEAAARHPAILSARAQLDAARRRIDATRADGLPTLDFSATRHVNGYPDQGVSAVSTRVTTYGLVLTLPLFEGFARTYRVRSMQAQLEQNEAGLQQARQQVALDVLKAHADATSARANLPAAAALVTAAEESARSSARRYDKGAADITELLSTQTGEAEARQERVRCLAEWHAARLRLLAAAGMMGAMGRQVDAGRAAQ